MKEGPRSWATVITTISLSLGVGSSPYAQTPPPVPTIAQKGEALATHATGLFDVTLNPQAPQDKADGVTLGRLSIDKQFHGDLEATSKGEMLTAASDSNGSAAYVAIERVTGTLHGRNGTFVLMHSGTMTRDAQQLTVTVAPSSDTGQLAGLAGRMVINIVDKKHFYDFEYTLAHAP